MQIGIEVFDQYRDTGQRALLFSTRRATLGQQRPGVVLVQHVHRLDPTIDRLAARQRGRQQVRRLQLATADRLAHRPGVQPLVVTFGQSFGTGIG